MKKQKEDLQRITKIKAFINKYSWKWKNYPSEKNYLEINCKNNVTTAINALHAIKEKICCAYAWKHNSNSEKQLFFSWFQTDKNDITLQTKNYQHY